MERQNTWTERVIAFLIAFVLAIPLGVIVTLMVWAAGLAVLFGVSRASFNKEKNSVEINTRH